MSTIKRRPLVVDEFLASKLMDTEQLAKRRQLVIRERLRDAPKFVLDSAASRYAGEMQRAHPLAIAHDQQFAIPPYPSMYIEFSIVQVIEGLAVQATSRDGSADEDLGFFVDGPRVYVLVRGSRASNMKPMISPFVYRLNQPFTLEEEHALCEELQTRPINLDHLYWGGLWHTVVESDQQRTGGPKLSHALRANHSFEWLWGREKANNKMENLMLGSAGDLRNILALLLFLNRTREVTIQDEVGVHRAMIHNKPSVLTKHTVIRLHLDPKPLFAKTYGTGGVWRREHDVRGHFCHDKTAREAEHHRAGKHDWREYDVNQWRCMLCGGLKWWRKACRRGSKDKGRIVKQYDVTK